LPTVRTSSSTTAGEGCYDRLPALAVELVRDQASIVFASGGGPSARAAMAATKSVAIVFSVGDDPVKLGLVASLGRPEGHVTGVTFTAAGLGAKRLELLRELTPKAAVIALLMNTGNPTPDLYQAESAARAIGQRILILNVTGMRDIDAAFASLVQQRADALPVTQDAIFLQQGAPLTELAARHAVRAMYTEREFVSAGGLMSYGKPLRDSYHQAGSYAARILKGAKPADLPIVQATRIELVINLKTAAALGLAVPPALLARADEVIE
jgi:putative tryptophan/tyrosine transport system substrate-binding protein